MENVKGWGCSEIGAFKEACWIKISLRACYSSPLVLSPLSVPGGMSPTAASMRQNARHAYICMRGLLGIQQMCACDNVFKGTLSPPFSLFCPCELMERAASLLPCFSTVCKVQKALPVIHYSQLKTCCLWWFCMWPKMNQTSSFTSKSEAAETIFFFFL